MHWCSVPKIKGRRKDRPRGLGKETSPAGRLGKTVWLFLPSSRSKRSARRPTLEGKGGGGGRDGEREGGGGGERAELVA